MRGRRRRRPICVYLVGGKPGSGGDGVVIGALDVREFRSHSFCFSSPTMASMRTIVWLTRSTPPLVQGW